MRPETPLCILNVRMGFPARRRTRIGLLASLLLLAGPIGPAAAESLPGPPLEPADRIGSFCSTAPSQSGPWTATQFALAAIASGWIARRRGPRDRSSDRAPRAPTPR